MGARQRGAPDFRLRPFTPGDAAALDAVEASALAVAGQADDLLTALQVRARRAMLAAQFPDAVDRAIEVDGRVVGRILTAEREGGLRAVDLALLPEWRGRGIGGAVLRRLQEEAAGRSLRLSVTRDNPARRLYERLGFRVYEEDDVHVRMQWRAERTGSPGADGGEE